MPMAEKIRIALIKRNMNLKELSSRLGCTSQNLSGKLKRDNFSERIDRNCRRYGLSF